MTMASTPTCAASLLCQPNTRLLTTSARARVQAMFTSGAIYNMDGPAPLLNQC